MRTRMLVLLAATVGAFAAMVGSAAAWPGQYGYNLYATNVSTTSAFLGFSYSTDSCGFFSYYNCTATITFYLNGNAVGTVNDSSGNAGVWAGVSSCVYYQLHEYAYDNIGWSNYYTYFDSGCNAPAISAPSASNVTATSADVSTSVGYNGDTNSVGLNTSLQVSTSPSFASVQTQSGSGTGPAATFSNLQPGTTYYMRAVSSACSSFCASATGSTSSFTTQSNSGPPTVQTGDVSGLTTRSATIAGTVNPDNLPTSYHFEYGTEAGYGTSIPVPDGSAGSGGAPVNESASLTGLTPNTTYHYRLVAANGTTVDGSDATFTTPAEMPAVTTGSGTPTSPTDATLAGTINPHHSDTTYHFEYGTDDSYGTSAPATDGDAGSADAPATVSETISGLQPNTTYHFRLVGTAGQVVVDGADATFTTPSASPVNTTPPSLTGTATVGGTVSASSGAWTGTQPITFGYAWERCDASGAQCQPIDGATDSSYVLTSQEQNGTVKVLVTATNAADAVSAISTASDEVSAASGAGESENVSEQLDEQKAEGSLSLPAGATESDSVTCPGSDLATDGSVLVKAVDQGTGSVADVIVDAAQPNGTGSYGFTVTNPTTGQAQVGLYVSCIGRATNTGATVAMLTTQTGAGESAAVTLSGPAPSATLRCPAGDTAVAPGFELPAGASARLVESEPGDDGSSWTFVFDGAGSGTAHVSVNCLHDTLSDGSTLVVSPDSRTASVGAGETSTSSLDVGPGANAVVGGYTVPGDDSVVVLGHEPQGRTQVYTLAGAPAGGGTVSLTAEALQITTDTPVPPDATTAPLTGADAPATQPNGQAGATGAGSQPAAGASPAATAAKPSATKAAPKPKAAKRTSAKAHRRKHAASKHRHVLKRRAGH